MLRKIIHKILSYLLYILENIIMTLENIRTYLVNSNIDDLIKIWTIILLIFVFSFIMGAYVLIKKLSKEV